MTNPNNFAGITENDAPFNGAADLRTSEFTSYTNVGSGPGSIATDVANAEQIAQRMDNSVENSIRYFG